MTDCSSHRRFILQEQLTPELLTKARFHHSQVNFVVSRQHRKQPNAGKTLASREPDLKKSIWLEVVAGSQEYATHRGHLKE